MYNIVDRSDIINVAINNVVGYETLLFICLKWIFLMWSRYCSLHWYNTVHCTYYQMFSTVASTVKDVDSTCKNLYIPAAFAIMGSIDSSRRRYAFTSKAITVSILLLSFQQTDLYFTYLKWVYRSYISVWKAINWLVQRYNSVLSYLRYFTTKSIGWISI